MCFSSPSVPEQKISPAPPAPEKPPEPPITVGDDQVARKKQGRSSLRIDLASASAGNTSLAASKSGVNV